MFAPTACITPTRLPTLWWSLAAALLLLGAFAPAIASDGCWPEPVPQAVGSAR
ncbi:MAG TPA: hypothetical protein VFK10_05535 [Burkholderiaceae bacterium]|nr:hypothetical protein [Burkholderiaceae bacterium]